jgi:hypothetical protein
VQQTQRLLAWAAPLGEERTWAVESADGLGKLLAQELLDEETAQAVAEARGCGFRVVRRDGVSLPVTMDLRSNRINATVENGRVTAVDVG